MANINQINEPDQSFKAFNSKVSKGTGTGDFENALDKALDKKKVSEMELSPANGLSEIASKDLNIINLSDIVSGKTDKLLEMLDSYASSLENPNISLKSISRVIEEIKDTAGNLKKEAEKLTGTDHRLKNIADHTIVTAHTEYLKFQRGDYLS